jgi:formylglycine-generating enzyme required for sulfatase activity
LIFIAGILLLGIVGIVLIGSYLEYKQASPTMATIDATSFPVQNPPPMPTSSPDIVSSPTVFFTASPFFAATAAFTDTPSGPKPGEEIINPKDGASIVYIPSGPFLMGLSDSQIGSLVQISAACTADQFESSGPQREEQTTGYWIYKTEVTNIMYRRCVAYGNCPPLHTVVEAGDDERPATYTNWQAAQSYCNWAGARLPTEQEWEKAARGTDGRLFPWGNEPPSPELANLVRYKGNTIRVGSYVRGASPYGVLDMAGNVREWLQDSITTGVTRGGSFGMEACFGTSGYRNLWKQSQGDYKTGFRCVLDQIP